MNFVAMKAVDYNLLLSFMNRISEGFAKYAISYGMSGISVKVLPAYPRDLSDYHKPSIIIQKVDMSKKSIGMGNVAGQYYDSSDDAYYDAFGVEHTMTLQIDVDCDSNTQKLLFEAIVADDTIMNDIKIINHGEFQINDYTNDVNNPVLDVGTGKVMGPCDVVSLETNDNNDYTGFIRLDIETIQTLVPEQTLVDLSKGIKYTQTIQL